jgi:hypothetical protein
MGLSAAIDAGFTFHDGLAYRTPPSRSFSSAEAGVTIPFTAMNLLILGWEEHVVERPEPLVLLPLGASVWSGALTAHGIWGAASPQSDPALVMGVSWAVGANVAFTVGAVGAATNRRLRVPELVLGSLELAGTAPTIAVGAYELASPGRPSKPVFAGLVAWSGALFVHGVASVVVGIKDRLDEPRRIEEEMKKNLEEHDRTHSSLRPRRVVLLPTVLPGGPAPAGGIVMSGLL